ncbi:MAG: cupin domain-containing protein [Rhodospirillaceae bacterium]
MSAIQKKSLDHADEIRDFDKGRIELVTVDGVMFGRCRFEPGWRWSSSLKSAVNTETCEAPHLCYHISGRLAYKMNDGTVAEFGPGDVSHVPPGHDAWVVGDEAAVVLDIAGGYNYARPYLPEVKKAGKKRAKPAPSGDAGVQALVDELEELDRVHKEKFDELDPEHLGIEVLQEKHQFAKKRHELVKKINLLSIEKTGEPYFSSYYASGGEE